MPLSYGLVPHLSKKLSKFPFLLNAEASLVDEQHWYYLTHSCEGDNRVYTFSNGISYKKNIIERLDFELAYFEATDQHFSFYVTSVIFWPSTRPPPQKNAIPRWCTGRKWHIPMACNRKRSRGRIKAYNMRQGEGPTVPIQTDAPEKSDLWTAWQLFPLDDD